MSIIKVQNLKKHFGKVKAVDDVCFDVEKGEIFGFLGPNGAGKTTTIRCMMDFIRPNSGSIKIFDKDSKKDSVGIKEDVGFLPSNPQLYEHWTGRDHITLVEKIHKGFGRAEEFIERLSFNPKMRVKNLSSGNKQKLALILVLITDPKLLILDEPTAGLDPLLQNTIYQILKEFSQKNVTVFMSSHNLAEVEKVCSRVGVIKAGKLITTESIKALKQKKVYTVTVDFEEKEKYKASDFEMDGIEIKQKTDHELILTVKGDINPLVKKLTRYELKNLEIIHASLEEIFLEFYKNSI